MILESAPLINYVYRSMKASDWDSVQWGFISIDGHLHDAAASSTQRKDVLSHLVSQVK